MKLKIDYFRNLTFGAEDSLVSTVGVLFGVASSGQSRGAILTTGLVVIVVEALSMGIGSYLTEESAHELEIAKNHDDNPVIGGVIMFFSYFFAGFIPLLPYAFFELSTAKIISVLFALGALFLLGFLPTKNVLKGARMLFVAGLAVLFGFLIGEAGKMYGA